MYNYSKYRPLEFDVRNGWIHNWFSNMKSCEIEIDGKLYPSVEVYYQSMKSDDPEISEYIRTNLSSYQSKKYAKNIKIRKDWDDVKLYVMLQGLLKKFNKDPFKSQLIFTKDDQIIEWNNWGDNYWGVNSEDCVGYNHLGRLLMIVRDLIIMQEEIKKN